MNKCLRCYKRIWPWQKEGNSPVDGTNDKVYFHLYTCATRVSRLRAWVYEWAYLIILLGIIGTLVGGLITAHFIWFLPKG